MEISIEQLAGVTGGVSWEATQRVIKEAALDANVGAGIGSFTGAITGGIAGGVSTGGVGIIPGAIFGPCGCPRHAADHGARSRGLQGCLGHPGQARELLEPGADTMERRDRARYGSCARDARPPRARQRAREDASRMAIPQSMIPIIRLRVSG